ncbi:hypothetical protein [Nocardia farcinica]
MLLPTVIAVGASVAGAGVAAADDSVVFGPAVFDSATVLQVPGLIVAPEPRNGAALVHPTVFHGPRGTINPTPAGFGYTFTWVNLSTGASGTVTDATPNRGEIHTGAGQLVVTSYLAGPIVNGRAPSFQTPAVGTFHVRG